MKELTQQLKEQARLLGFELVGVALAAEPRRLHKLHEWLDAGFSANMLYMDDRRAAYQHPSAVLAGCKSLLMLGLPYLTTHEQKRPRTAAAGQALIARYAHAEVDYHTTIHARLKKLKAWLQEARPAAKVRGIVDTAPLLEREFAELAGLGWVGKNTLLLNRQWGSYFFLASLLTDLELVADESFGEGYCGTCTACLTHCPTEAFPEPYVLDANRCLSYLTIEHRDAIPTELVGQMGDWMFGCDICQEVCPWNRKAALSTDASCEPLADLQDFDVLTVLDMDDDAFRARFRQTPLWRSKRRGVLRNAILVAGNQQLQAAAVSLVRLLQDPESLLRGAAAWSLARIAPPNWQSDLQAALARETDPQALTAISQALSNCSRGA